MDASLEVDDFGGVNGARLLVRGLVKRPGKARPNQLSNSTLEFHQTTYQKPYPIITAPSRETVTPAFF